MYTSIVRASIGSPRRTRLATSGLGRDPGAIPGLVGGLILNQLCYNEIGSCPGAAIGLTALGASVGAGIGFVADNGRQTLIYDRKLASADPTLVFRTALRWR